MPKKSTSHLENELKRSESLEAFLDNNQDELSREELPERNSPGQKVWRSAQLCVLWCFSLPGAS